MGIFAATQKYISVVSAIVALILHSKPWWVKGSPPWLRAENLSCNSGYMEIYNEEGYVSAQYNKSFL